MHESTSGLISEAILSTNGYKRILEKKGKILFSRTAASYFDSLMEIGRSVGKAFSS